MAKFFTQKFFQMKIVNSVFKILFHCLLLYALHWLFLLRFEAQSCMLLRCVCSQSASRGYLTKLLPQQQLYSSPRNGWKGLLSLLSIAKIDESQVQFLLYGFFIQFVWLTVSKNFRVFVHKRGDSIKRMLELKSIHLCDDN